MASSDTLPPGWDTFQAPRPPAGAPTGKQVFRYPRLWGTPVKPPQLLNHWFCCLFLNEMKVALCSTSLSRVPGLKRTLSLSMWRSLGPCSRHCHHSRFQLESQRAWTIFRPQQLYILTFPSITVLWTCRQKATLVTFPFLNHF